MIGFLIIVVVIVGLWGIALYNTLVRRKNAIDQAFAGIDVQLTQRYDLIPKVVETVKQYMSHERSLLENIVRLRSEAMNARTPDAKIAADNEMTRALGQLNVTMENYPQLRSSENFLHLQRTLNEVEEQLAAARRSYNAAVTEFNIAVESFPSNLIADRLGFEKTRAVFEAPEAKRGDVDMKGLFKA